MAGFELSRSIHVAADPARVHDLLDDFHQWREWSPWEDVDPGLQRSYSGPDRGVGGHFAWQGNSKAGEGSMEIVECDDAHTTVDLRFFKPFKATNVCRFDVVPTGGGSDVTWTMTGRRNVVMGLMGRLFFDKAIGKDFDKGLAQLKSAAETS